MNADFTNQFSMHRSPETQRFARALQPNDRRLPVAAGSPLCRFRTAWEL